MNKYRIVITDNDTYRIQIKHFFSWSFCSSEYIDLDHARRTLDSFIAIEKEDIENENRFIRRGTVKEIIYENK